MFFSADFGFKRREILFRYYQLIYPLDKIVCPTYYLRFINMLKTCPKCKQSFDCCANDILTCHCFSVTIDAETLIGLKDEYDDCLCAKCLKDFAVESKK